MKVPHIIGISGPPRSGKDTFCQFLLEALEKHTSLRELAEPQARLTALRPHMRVAVHRMSHPLKLLAVQMLPEQKWGVEALKDSPMNAAGTTYRDVQIQIYHLGAKLFGPDWLGHHFVRAVYVYKNFDFILMPDCGRPEDIQPLLDLELPFSRVHMHRNGTGYEGDSRVDFYFEGTYHVINNTDLDHLKSEAKLFLTNLLSHKAEVIADAGLTKQEE